MMKTGILFAALFAAVAACAQDAAPEGSGQSPAANAPWTLGPSQYSFNVLKI